MSLQYNRELEKLIKEVRRRYPNATLEMLPAAIGDDFGSKSFGDDCSSELNVRVTTGARTSLGPAILTLKDFLQ